MKPAAPGRIPCINPVCRRTAPAEKYDAGDEIVCAKCWKLLPRALTDRYRALKRHEKRLLQLIGRRVARRTIAADRLRAIEARFAACRAANWRLIHDHFMKPDKPVGLDAFLEEMGLS